MMIIWARGDSHPRSSASRADVIATRPQAQYFNGTKRACERMSHNLSNVFTFATRPQAHYCYVKVVSVY